MKLNYPFIALLLMSTQSIAQVCSNIPPPTVSGNTIAVCTPSAVFSITASAQPTNSLLWYQGSGTITTSSVLVTPPVTSSANYSVSQVGIGTQSLTMPAHVSSYPGQVRGYWFQAPVNFTINGVWVPTDVGTGNASAAVLRLGASPPPSYPTVSNTFTTAFLAQNVPGVAVMATNIAVSAGEYIGVLGSRGGNTSYAPSPFVASLGSNAITITRMGMQFDLTTVAPQDIWTEAGGSVGRVFLFADVPCMSPATPVTLSVTPIPVVSISTSTTRVCSGSSVSLTASGALNNYTWSTNGTGSLLVTSPTSTGTYTVFGSSGGTCTAASAPITISVDPGLPVPVGVASSPTICLGNTVSLTGSGNPGYPYTWSNGITDGVAFSPTTTTGYIISTPNSCGTGTAMTTVTVHPLPSITGGALSTVCDGETATLSASGGINYTWTPGNYTLASVMITPSVSTAFMVVGDNQFGCVSSGNQVVIVNPNPTVTAGASATAVCPGGAVTLISTGTGGTYQWNHGPTTASTSASPVQNSVYTVTLTNQFNCTSTSSIAVNVHQPTVDITGPSGSCPGAEVTLSGGAASSYTWMPAGLHFPAISFTPTGNVSTTLIALVNMGNTLCIAEAVKSTTLHPNPVVTASPDRSVVCRNESGTLTASGASTYTWTSVSPGVSVTVKYNVSPGPRAYSVTGTDANGCVGTAVAQVVVNACTGISEFNERGILIYPNPSDGSIWLNSETATTLVILDALGKTVATVECGGEHGAASVSGLAEGIYYITGGEIPVVRKLVVK